MAGKLDALAPVVKREIALHHIPGAVILAGDSRGVIYRRAFGDRIIASHPIPMDANAIFDLASLTKVIANTTAIMQLAERGEIELDARVLKYWPAFAAHGKEDITVEQLLTHLSGLRPDIQGTARWSGEKEALAEIVSDHPIAPPGTRFIYSDVNFIVLGELVRRVSGETLDSYALRHIFNPLGMFDTRFKPDAAQKPRIVPTDGSSVGYVQDPTAFRMGGVAGHAGLFSTADDLARFAQMLLGKGSREGARILSPASVAQMTQSINLPGGIRRGLGWDIASDYDSGMAQAFGPSSYGHTGYTGTSLWIDPDAGVYLIVLTSRLYPDGRGDAQPVRKDAAIVVAAAYRPELLTGIDGLEEEQFAPLRGMTVGLLTNQTGRDRTGRRTIDVLAHAPDVRLAAIFTPEHGLNADREGRIPSGTDAATGLALYSLYGDDRRPDAAMLKGLDAVVVDLQDAGARFYTYPTTVAYLMEAAAKNHMKVVVLDRPNPIAAAGVKGPMLERGHESFTGYFSMPVQHGMTLGELAMMFNAENRLGADLSVIAMRGYRGDLWYDQTGLQWVNPSPNLRTVPEAILYPALGLIEGTNISVGRGTATPFEIAGAPWIDGAMLAAYLNARKIAGVNFVPIQFTPESDRYEHQQCNGIRIEIADRALLDSPLLGLEIASALHRLYPREWSAAALRSALGAEANFEALQNGDDPRVIAAGWRRDISGFEIVRAKYRLYRTPIIRAHDRG